MSLLKEGANVGGITIPPNDSVIYNWALKSRKDEIARSHRILRKDMQGLRNTKSSQF